MEEGAGAETEPLLPPPSAPCGSRAPPSRLYSGSRDSAAPGDDAQSGDGGSGASGLPYANGNGEPEWRRLGGEDRVFLLPASPKEVGTVVVVTQWPSRQGDCSGVVFNVRRTDLHFGNEKLRVLNPKPHPQPREGFPALTPDKG